MDSASHTSEESVYHSCSENSAWESDQDDEPHYTAAPACYLGSTSATLLSPESETLRLLVCLNAARILLAEITNSARKAGSLRPFEGAAILKRILAIGTGWNRATNEEFGTIVALPIFQSSLGLLRSERRPCSQNNIDGFIAQLQDKSSAAIVIGQNDALTIVGASSNSGGKPSSYIVFNPQCRASTDLGGASLRFFATSKETVEHVYNIMAIHRGGESNAPHHMYSGYILVPPCDTVSPRHEIASQYEANLRILQEDLELRTVRARELSLGADIARLQSMIELELQGERDTFARRDQILAETVALDLDLIDVHVFTATILAVHPSPENITVDIETETGQLGRVDGGREATPSKQDGLSEDTSPTTSRRSEVSTPPTSPETLWNPPAEGDLPRKAKIQTEGEESTQEAQTLPTQMAEEAASLGLARILVEEDEAVSLGLARKLVEDDDEAASLGLTRKLMEEDEAVSLGLARKLVEEENEAASLGLARKLVEDEVELENGSLECPCCLDKCHKSFMVNMEECDHVTCRTCLQEYVGGQVGAEVPPGPMSCPVCAEE